MTSWIFSWLTSDTMLDGNSPLLEFVSSSPDESGCSCNSVWHTTLCEPTSKSLRCSSSTFTFWSLPNPKGFDTGFAIVDVASSDSVREYWLSSDCGRFDAAVAIVDDAFCFRSYFLRRPIISKTWRSLWEPLILASLPNPRRLSSMWNKQYCCWIMNYELVMLYDWLVLSYIHKYIFTI